MQPLKIAIIRQKYRPDGGAERFIARALEALGQQGVELTVLAREWSGAGEVRVIPCNPAYRGRVGRERSFAETVCRTLKDHAFDLVQSHERVPCGDIYRAGDGVHREWLAQRSRVQGSLKNWFQSRSGFHRYMLEAERAVFENPLLRAVICNSNMVKAEILSRFAIAEDKIRVIYNGIDTEQFHPRLKDSRTQTREKLGVAGQVPCFLFVGSGFERKGLQFAIKALAAANTGALLWVVGQDKDQRLYQKLARELGVADRVQFFGLQQDVKPFYGAADAFLFPTLYDPFPNAVLEAMASGLPVISSTKCGGAEYVKDGENGYIADALDEARLAEAVRRLSDPVVAAKLGKNARAVAETLDVRSMANQLIHLYRELLSSNT